MIDHKILLGKKIDRLLLLIIIVLTLFGLIAVYNSSVVIGSYDFQDKNYFLKEEIKWILIGSIFLFIFSKINYQRWFNYSIFFILLAIFLLFVVLLPGIGVATKGAQRWLFFGGQPSEFAKIAMVMYLSAWFSTKEKNRLWAFILLCSLLVGLILLQPDMGTAGIIGISAIILYFISNAPFWHFLIFLPGSFILGFVLIKIAPYRFDRLTTFLNPEKDPLGVSYHIRQILIALGSGGLWGVGIGKSRQKYSYVPESNTDSIFAIIGEEMGFIGAMVLIILFFLLIYRGFKIAHHCHDQFGKLLAFGITTLFALQVIINLGSMVALVPLTGVPLPFLSYGGSSLVITMMAMGILLNISKEGQR